MMQAEKIVFIYFGKSEQQPDLPNDMSPSGDEIKRSYIHALS